MAEKEEMAEKQRAKAGISTVKVQPVAKEAVASVASTHSSPLNSNNRGNSSSRSNSSSGSNSSNHSSNSSSGSNSSNHSSSSSNSNPH